MNIDESFDFGFSSHSEDEMSIEHIKSAKTAEAKLQQLYDLIIPLLDNLAKDADTKPIINWPNRKTKIDEFKKKIDQLLQS